MRSALPAAVVLATAALASAQGFDARFETIRGEATPRELYRLLYAVPKGGDLHNHLGGAAFDDVLWELATDPRSNGGRTFRSRVRINECTPGCGTPLLYHHTISDRTHEALSPCCREEYEPLSELSPGAREEWLSSTRLDLPGEGRNEFFENIWPRITEVLDQASLLAELAVRNMEYFAHEGVRYVEFQISPWGRYDGDRPLTADEFHEVLAERLSRPDALATGVTVRFQTNILRFLPSAEERIEDSYAFIDRHRDLWVSLNLVGREDNDKGYPLRFLDTFRKMRRRYADISLSIHGGEVDEPNRHVRDTLLLGASRIGHGTNLVTDPDTLLLMRTGPFTVEISLVSNHLLEYVSDHDVHPFAEYLRLGIPVALATDDRGMWDSNLTDEYYAATTAFHLSWNEIVRLGRESLEAAFLPRAIQSRLLEEYDSDVRAFEERFGAGDWRRALRDTPERTSGYAERHFLN